MKFLKKIIVSIVAYAIALQAQANVSEYATHIKEFVWNHKGKIAIGLVTISVTSGLYGLLCRYMEKYKLQPKWQEPTPEYQLQLDTQTNKMLQEGAAIRELQNFTPEEEMAFLSQLNNEISALVGLENERDFWIGQAADIIQICLQQRIHVSEDARKKMYSILKKTCNDLIEKEFVFEGNLSAELNALKIACDRAFDGDKGDDFDATISTTYEKIETAASNIAQILKQN